MLSRTVSPRLRVLPGIALVHLGLAIGPLWGEGVVDTCSATSFESALDQALSGGGRVTITCTGTNHLTGVKVIAANTTIESSTGQGWLVGGGSNSLFHIQSGVTLTLIDLQLAGGRSGFTNGTDGTGGSDGQAGSDGRGGAVFNQGGTLIATNVRFHDHQAVGGAGGQGTDVNNASQPTDGGRGGHGYGGAIHSQGGTVILTNCTFDLNRAEGGLGGRGGSSLTFPNDGGGGGGAGAGAGGALYLTDGATLHAVDCDFQNNEAIGAQGGFGGAGQGFLSFDGSDGASTPGRGGAIFHQGGSSTLIDCTFQENSVTGADGVAASTNAGTLDEAKGESGQLAQGGAVALVAGSLVIHTSSFADNWALGGNGGNGGLTGGVGDGGDGGDGAPAQGAAVHASQTSLLRVLDTSFARNSVVGGLGGFGAPGATGLAFTGKDGGAGSGLGGAVHVDGETVEINRCTLDGNDATGAEGLKGVPGNAYNAGGEGNRGGAALGGGVYASVTTLAVTNSTFHANAAFGGAGGAGGDGGTGLAFATDGGDGGAGGAASGGALWIDADQQALIIHSTFATNRVVAGAGGAGGEPGDTDLARPGNDGASGLARGASVFSGSPGVVLRGTILAYPGGGENASGILTDSGFNVSSDHTPLFPPLGFSFNNTDPLLGALTDHQGPTRTMAPAAGSPVIDLGQPIPSLLIDQRGLARDNQPDAGAYETGAGAPPLSIATTSGLVTLSWPATGATYLLQASGSAAAPIWTNLSGAVLTDDQWTLDVTPDPPRHFYRLLR